MKIPTHATKVFTGKIFDVYQWEQEMYDGTTATFEALKRPATVQIIPVRGDRLYLSREEQPSKPLTYTFLGGRQEKDEPPENTAKRELLEEAGFSSEDWELFKKYTTDGKIEWDTYLFIARNVKKVQEPHLDAGEKVEVIETNLDEFLEIVDSEKFWGKKISDDFYRIKTAPEQLENLKQKLFQ